jgi:zeaxanthin epoxidase
MEEGIRFENFNYAGIVTKMLQPILPVFFTVQFNFLYEGWKNEIAIDVVASLGIVLIGGTILLLGAGTEAGLVGLGLEGLLGTEGLEAILANVQDFF